MSKRVPDIETDNFSATISRGFTAALYATVGAVLGIIWSGGSRK
jgi:hypothetical protein